MCVHISPLASLLPHAHSSARTAVGRTLRLFGKPALSFAARAGIQVIPLRRVQRYADVSAALRRLCASIDEWPAPPAGLFVVEERTVYLRSRSPMTVAHEFGHALDCALGGGIYRSTNDPVVRALFEAARDFVTPYAATGIDEYFAECMRAFVGANDPASCWPPATRERLRRVDAGMSDYIKRLFAVEFE
ncbi:MAG: hypothetical protein JO024_02990 [Candidatus Eremiobacteraeota bacterium]|nr:hypothetical protein [Candidatus Eremiobacteraeota bacterium]